jgi:hypothetical protein
MTTHIDLSLSRDDQHRVRDELKHLLRLLQTVPCDECEAAKHLGRARMLMKYGSDGIDRTAEPWITFGPSKVRQDGSTVVIDAEGASVELRAALAEIAFLPEDVARDFAGRRAAVELITHSLALMSPRVKKRPGRRRTYSLKAWQFAKEIQRSDATLTTAEIKKRVREALPGERIPKDLKLFDDWLRYEPKELSGK